MVMVRLGSREASRRAARSCTICGVVNALPELVLPEQRNAHVASDDSRAHTLEQGLVSTITPPGFVRQLG